MANQTIPGLNTITSPSSAGLLWVSDPNASPQDRSLTLANLQAYLIAKNIGVSLVSQVIGASGKALSSTPYTLAVPFPYAVFYVTTGASAFVFNLPTAASALGNGPVTIVKADSGAGAIQIAPNGSDVIDKAGNVSIYLGAQWQSLTLQASASGQWTVLGGTFAPHQGTDTDGSQYQLGKLRHLPLGNTTSRQLYNAAPPATGVWSAAVSAAGIVGVPSGAKAVRVKVRLVTSVPSTAYGELVLYFSDNNSNTPSDITAHPAIGLLAYTFSGGSTYLWGEVDIPLNSSGQFYFYNTSANVTVASCIVIIAAVGYYMGD